MTTATEDRTDLIFKALASRPRREILALLAVGVGREDKRCCAGDEVCACVFSERLGLGAPTVSHHMKALLDAGLVTSQKRGVWVYYRLQADVLDSAIDELRAFMCREDAVSGAGSCCNRAEA
jgi:ArsR family transcriptional regulator